MHFQYLALEEKGHIACGSAGRWPLMPACGGIKEATSPATRAARGARARSARAPLSCLLHGKWTHKEPYGFSFFHHIVTLFPLFSTAYLWCLLRLSANYTEGEINVSDLRLIRTPSDARAYRKLMLARHYHDQPLKFLTLTFKEVPPKTTKNNPYKLLLKHLIQYLDRQGYSIEYLAVQTNEGNGVFHLAIISDYIHHSRIRSWWLEHTGAFNIHISQEKNLPSFLSEMTGQQHTLRYSMSRNFIPKGSLTYLESMKTYFTGKTLNRACVQYAKRLRTSSPDQAFERTCRCIERGYGVCSLLTTKTVLYNGR